MVYLLALGAALSNALTTVLQRQGLVGAPPNASLHLRLITYALHRPVWLAGFGTMIGAFAFQVAALGVGPLSIVQPILTSELVFLVVIVSVGFRRHLGWHEWVGSLATTGGLGAFLSMAHPAGGDVIPGTRNWAAVLLVLTMAVALAALAGRIGPPAWKAVMFGVAAAVAFSTTAALVKATTTYASHGPAGILVHWEPYGIVLSGLSGLFLAQNAYHAGPIMVSQPVLVIVDALVSIALGVSLFGERIHADGPIAVLELLALSLMSGGVLILCRSPAMVKVKADPPATPSGPLPSLLANDNRCKRYGSNRRNCNRS